MVKAGGRGRLRGTENFKMARRKVVLLKGDGIGPEVVDSTVEVIEASGVDIEWIERPMGLCAFKEFGDAFPSHTAATIREVGAALKGPTATPKDGGFVSANLRMRRELDLFLGLRPSLRLPFPCVYGAPIDVVVIRENLGGFYGSKETLVVLPDGEEEAHLSAVFTSKEIRRVTREAALWARANGRKKVTLVTKSNIMPVWGGVYLRAFYAVMAEFPDLVADDLLIDAVGERLVTRPETLDVIVLENLFGDIMSDVAGGLAGGLGIATGVNVGDRIRVYEAVHGTAPDIVGEDKANPLALLLSSIPMLRHLGFEAEADRIHAQTMGLIAAGTAVTGDLRKFYPSGTPLVGTRAFTRALCDRVSHA